MNKAKKLKDTLNLPQTDFPMRANAVESEPQRVQYWEESDVYHKVVDKNKILSKNKVKANDGSLCHL